MSRYNSYARKADEAFREARKTFLSAAEALNTAEQAERKLRYSNDPESYIGENTHKKTIAAANVSKARCEYEKARNVWENFDATMKTLRAQLANEVNGDNTVSAEAVDSTALELLKSGVMNVADYQKFAHKYSDNPTMMRLVSKYASDTAKSIRNNVNASELERANAMQLEAIGHKYNENVNAVLESWDAMHTGFNAISGRSASGERKIDPNHAEYMLNQYDALMSNVIENF